jgi:hypothetical protein
MVTTTSDSTDFLIEWLRGPGRAPYKKWLRYLHGRFYTPPRHRRAQLATLPREDAQARERIGSLLLNLKELAALGKTNWTQFKKVGTQINTNLERYQYSPCLFLDQPLSYVGPPPRRFKWEKGGVFRWGMNRFKSGTPPQELYALRIIEQILGNRWVCREHHPGLNAIRQCEQCSCWFLARKPWAKLCGSPACRQLAKRAYQSSETYKANRRMKGGNP